MTHVGDAIEGERQQVASVTLLRELVTEALASGAVSGSTRARRALGLLLQAAEEGTRLNQRELAERLYGDVSDTSCDNARKAVGYLREKLRRVHWARRERLMIPKRDYFLSIEVEVPPLAGAPIATAPAAPLKALHAAFAVLLAAGSLVGVLWWRSAARGPVVDLRLDNRSVSGVGPAADVLWSFEHPELVPQWGIPHDRLIGDLDFDGDRDAALLYNSPQSAGCDGTLVVLDDGRLRFARRLGLELEFGGRAWLDCLAGLHVRDVSALATGPSDAVLLTVASHVSGSPTRVQTWSTSGSAIGELWHYGHLPAFATWDSDGDGREEVVLGGTSEEMGEAVIIVLERGAFRGAGPPQTRGSRFGTCQRV